MITEDDRRALADLALRALDKIADEYGEDSDLITASLAFEVRTKDEDGDNLWHSNYESLAGSSPNHVAGLLWGVANWISGPDHD